MDNEMKELCLEFCLELINTATDDFHRYKLMLLAYAAENSRLTKVLNTIFDIAAKHRPLLIELKGGTC